MKEQLVENSTARLAKSIGFDWACSTVCFLNSEDYRTLKYYEEGAGYVENSSIDSDADYDCTKPTQSFLQKWLREKHNIHVDVRITNIGRYYNQVFYFDNNNRSNCLFFISQNVSHNKFDKFEEALEEGLIIALNIKTK